MKGPVIALLLILVISCSDKSGKELLSEKQMTEVIWDIMQADEFATTYVSKDTLLVLKNERMKLYKDVFRIHQLTEERFAASYKYYSARPDVMKLIFDSLSSRGERERKTLYLPKDTLPKK